MSYRIFLPGLLVVAASVLTGCYGGNESVTAFHVSGEVQFDGKPLPAGRIYFTPDASLGNQGPQGTAMIQDGKYDTEDSRFGIVGGPYIVRIEGYDGIQPPNDEDGLFPDGQVLFRDYEVKLEFPQANHVEDLDIPGIASKRKQPQGRQNVTVFLLAHPLITQQRKVNWKSRKFPMTWDYLLLETTRSLPASSFLP